MSWARAHDVPEGSAWLGLRERALEATLVRPHRRLDWRSGRWAMKTALGLELDAMASVEILADSDGAPRAWRGEHLLDLSVSLSHRAGWAVAGWAPGPCPIGVDLELVEPRTPAFVSDFFTGSEARRHADLPPSLQEVHAVVVWSAKEAALKVARTGLRRDTRGVVVDVEIEPPDAIASGELVLGPWRRLVVEDVERNVRLQGGFRRRGELVLTWLRDTARPNGASSDQAPREAR